MEAPLLAKHTMLLKPFFCHPNFSQTGQKFSGYSQTRGLLHLNKIKVK
jgi:hypothetical protein